MINPIANASLFSKKQIEDVRRSTSTVLTEQVAHCLELVSELASQDLKFCFKGGNSQLILLEKPKRFSIDVDISTDETIEKISSCVEHAIGKWGVFTRFNKRQHKTKPWLPMVSYDIYYKSHFTESGENFIMLDAVLKKSFYKTIEKRVECMDIYKSDSTVVLPSVSSLIGDKLLTLGPNTLGIPLGKNKEAQRLKHSFDVSVLLNNNPNLENIRSSIQTCIKQENEIQESSVSFNNVLDDTLQYCALPFRFMEEPDDVENPALAEIIKGRELFETHIFEPFYSWEMLKMDLARSALALVAAFETTVTDSDFNKALLLGNPALLWKQITLWLGFDPVN